MSSGRALRRRGPGCPPPARWWASGRRYAAAPIVAELEVLERAQVPPVLDGPVGGGADDQQRDDHADPDDPVAAGPLGRTSARPSSCRRGLGARSSRSWASWPRRRSSRCGGTSDVAGRRRGSTEEVYGTAGRHRCPTPESPAGTGSHPHAKASGATRGSSGAASWPLRGEGGASASRPAPGRAGPRAPRPTPRHRSRPGPRGRRPGRGRPPRARRTRTGHRTRAAPGRRPRARRRPAGSTRRASPRTSANGRPESLPCTSSAAPATSSATAGAVTASSLPCASTRPAVVVRTTGARRPRWRCRSGPRATRGRRCR